MLMKLSVEADTQIQGTEQVAGWAWSTGRDHLPPFNLTPVTE